MQTTITDSITGCLLGTAVGDALGLPFEGMTARRGRRLFGRADAHHLIMGRGMTSDDTEHTCMVVDALIESAGDRATFERALVSSLRMWLATLPAAAGLATLRATLKLCAGIGPQRSGVFSAGNAPAMRSALIGVCHGQDAVRLRDLIAASTRVTHTDPKAEHAALAVAIAAHLSRCGTDSPAEYMEAVREALADQPSEFLKRLDAVAESAGAGTATAAFATRMGWTRGPSGYCMESVPAALHAWLRHPADYGAAVLEAIECGGDTDTMAAITGGIVGARVGLAGIPKDWIEGLADWPRTTGWMKTQANVLGRVMESGVGQRGPSLPFAGLVARNGVFAAIVIGHGLRRLLPPY